MKSQLHLRRFRTVYMTCLILVGAINWSIAQPTDPLPNQPQFFGPEHINELAKASQTGTIQVTIRGGQTPISLGYEVIDDMVVAEGDIILGGKEILNSAAILNLPIAAWPNSTMPYTIDPTHPNIPMIQYAINQINAETNLCMVPRTTEANYVEFINSAGCASFVGMIGGLQNIFVNPGCGISSTVHEILHAAGHWHEQSRQDRDNFVTINTPEIRPDRAFNFDKYSVGLDQGPYDFNSIMHYGEFDFTQTGNATISLKVPPATPFTDVGQRIRMSQGDIDAVNFTYPECTNTVEPISMPWNLSFASQPRVEFCGSVVTISNVTVENTGGTASLQSQMVYGLFFNGRPFTMDDSPNDRPIIPPLQPGEKFTLPTYTVDQAALVGFTLTYFAWIDGFGIHFGTEDRSDNLRWWNGVSHTITAACDQVITSDNFRLDDPCSCEAPNNCRSGEDVTFFDDTLTVTGAPAGANIVLTNNGGAGVFMTGSCPTPTDTPNGTIIGTTDANGDAKLQFFHRSGATGTIQVTVLGTTVPFTVNACNAADCRKAPIPTMSEWGLMIFGLLVMNMSVYFLRRKEQILG